MYFAKLATPLLLFRQTHGAFVQMHSCKGHESKTQGPATYSWTSAKLTRMGDTTLLGLTVNNAFKDKETCNQVSETVHNFDLDVESFGHSAGQQRSFRASCIDSKNPRPGETILGNYDAEYSIARTRAFLTLEIIANITDDNGDVVQCFKTALTPKVAATISNGLKYGLIAILCFSSICTLSALRQEWKKNRHLMNSLFHHSIEAFIPGADDCLQHVQFLWLLGALSLDVPGYLRPLLSSFSWSTLTEFRTLPTQFHYPGVQDGYYALNATQGLEEMAQVLGAASLSDLWISVALNILIVMVAVAIIVSVTRWTRRSDYQRPKDAFEYLSWNVLRVFHSYFLQPLVTLVSYQLTRTRFMSAVHITSAILIITLLLTALSITFRRLVVQQHGYNLLSDSGSVGMDVDVRADRILTVIIYVALVSRSVIIGTAQDNGLALIIGLALTEIVVIGGLWVWRGSQLPKFMTLAVTRFISVCPMSFFLKSGWLNPVQRRGIVFAIFAVNAVCLAGVSILKPLQEVFLAFGWNKGAQEESKRGSSIPPNVLGIFELSQRDSTPQPQVVEPDTIQQQPNGCQPRRVRPS